MGARTPARADLRRPVLAAGLIAASATALLGCSPDEEPPGSVAVDASLLDGASSDAPAPHVPDATTATADASGGGAPGSSDGSSEVGDAREASSAPYPPLLSQTGLYADVPTETLGDGVRPFHPAHALWTDGATKRRWVRLPAAPIDTSDMSFWRYPEGTKLWKEFSRDGQRIETRLLHKRGPGPGDWAMIAYLWLEDGSDAVAVPDGVENARGTSHDVPPEDACQFCHGNMEDRALGFSALQLSHDPGGVTLDDLVREGLLSVAPAAPIVLPGDAATQMAVGYLHANCGVCHNPTSEVFASLDMNLWQSATALAGVEDTNVYQTAVDLPDPGASVNRIVPGDPARSMVYVRMSVRGNGQMPPIGTEVQHSEGLSLVAEFIRSLGVVDAGAEAGIPDAAARD